MAAIPTLDATRVRLRALEHDDADALVRIFGDPEVTRFFGISLKDGEGAIALVDDIERKAEADVLVQWGIERLRDERLVGTCTLAHIDRRNERAELGFALGRVHWGQGFATEAVTRVLRFAFEDWKLHRVEADVDPRNVGSLRRLKQLGFVREGLLRERWLLQGERQDSVLLGLLASEWSGGSGPER